MYLLWTICDWTLRWVIGLVCHEYYESWMNRLLSDTAIVLWIPVLFSTCLQVFAGKYETFSYIKSTYLCLYDVCTVFSILLHRGLDSAWQLWLYLSKILLLSVENILRYFQGQFRDFRETIVLIKLFEIVTVNILKYSTSILLFRSWAFYLPTLSIKVVEGLGTI